MSGDEPAPEPVVGDAPAIARQVVESGPAPCEIGRVPANGHLLRRAVLQLADQIDGALRDWIDAGCCFPCAMVDRIVSRTTAADRTAICAALGCADAWAVLAEPFVDWAVEDRFAAGRPDWTLAGARFVADAEPWDRLKLRLVNGSHSCIAWLGVVAGWHTVDAAMAQPALRGCIESLMRDEIEPTLPPLPGLDLAGYRTQLLARFANPALAHRTAQIAMDNSQKLPQRPLDTLRDRVEMSVDMARLALGIAAWLHYLGGVDESGVSYPIDDPLLGALIDLQRAALASNTQGVSDAAVRQLLGFTPVFGDLAGSAARVQAVRPALQSLRDRGVLATLRSLAAPSACTVAKVSGAPAPRPMRGHGHQMPGRSIGPRAGGPAACTAGDVTGAVGCGPRGVSVIARIAAFLVGVWQRRPSASTPRCGGHRPPAGAWPPSGGCGGSIVRCASLCSPAARCGAVRCGRCSPCGPAPLPCVTEKHIFRPPSKTRDGKCRRCE